MKWNLAKPITKTEQDCFPEIHPVVLQLLFNRGLTTQEKIDEFLYPDYSQDIHDPYLFNDMAKVVARLVTAHKKKEKICIFGDYDVDGVTGSVILTTVLTDLGYQVFSYIPHRDREGYGLNKSAVDKIVADRADLIISVDCGISNYEEVSLAKEKYGIDMIIVDHHDEPAKLPPAVAIIHCHLPGEKYPFKSLSGGGTAFKVAQALLREEFFGLNKKDIEMKEKWLLDLVALSTIGDIMPLLGENRTLVKYGLLVLQKTRRLGLLKLYEGANIDAKKINTQVVGWQINPRINAAGRLEHANLAYQLLTTNNVEQAIMMAHLLNQSNIERQAKTEAFFNEAVEKIKANYDQEIPRQALVIRNDDWAAGVLGLVAGRLAKKYNRPVYVFTKVGENVVGSGRSIEGFDVTRLLQQNSELLLKFGGHVGACGLSVSPEKFVLFKERLEKLSASELERQELTAVLEVDAEVKFADFNWQLFEEIEKFEPFGESNSEPNFVIKNLVVRDWQTVGSDNQHLRLALAQGNQVRKAIAFGLGDWAKDLRIESLVDIVCQIGVNEWNGNRELQMSVQDIKIVNNPGR